MSTYMLVRMQFQRDVDRLFAEEVKKQQKAEEACVSTYG